MKIESLTFQSIPEGLDGLVISVLFLHWLVARSTGCFCVTEGISGHWARTLGEESIWETRGSVSHLFLAEIPGRIRED